MKFDRAASWTVPAGQSVVIGHPDPTDPVAEGWVSGGSDVRGAARIGKEDVTGHRLENVLETPVSHWPDDDHRDRPTIGAQAPIFQSDEKLVVDLAVDVDVDADDLEFRIPLSVKYLHDDRREMQVLTHRGADRLEDVRGHSLTGPEPTVKQTDAERLRDLREIHRDQLLGPERPGEGRQLTELERWWHQ